MARLPSSTLCHFEKRMTSPLLETLDLSHIFSGTFPVPILERISFTIHRGESLAITGVSGSGKSTLLQILGLLAHASSGKILHQGRSIPLHEQASWRNRQLGFVFQHCHLLEESTPIQNVLMPAAIARWPEGKASSRKRAVELLERVGLGDRLELPCRLLSGGEKQRVAIARALMNRPPLLLADEPSGNLDSKTGQLIHDLLLEQVSSETSLCVVTHDLDFARRCKRTFRLSHGQLAPMTPLDFQTPESPSHSSGWQSLHL